MVFFFHAWIFYYGSDDGGDGDGTQEVPRVAFQAELPVERLEGQLEDSQEAQRVDSLEGQPVVQQEEEPADQLVVRRGVLQEELLGVQ